MKLPKPIFPDAPRKKPKKTPKQTTRKKRKGGMPRITGIYEVGSGVVPEQLRYRPVSRPTSRWSH